jgi:hypothetical protein
LFKSGSIFWLEILHIGTLRARYRGDGGEAHVFYEAYGKELIEEIVNGILPAFDYFENRLTGNSNYMFRCGPSYLICELVHIFDRSYVSERSATIDLVRDLSNSSRWGEAGPHSAIAARPAHLHRGC